MTIEFNTLSLIKYEAIEHVCFPLMYEFFIEAVVGYFIDLTVTFGYEEEDEKQLLILLCM